MIMSITNSLNTIRKSVQLDLKKPDVLSEREIDNASEVPSPNEPATFMIKVFTDNLIQLRDLVNSTG